VSHDYEDFQKPKRNKIKRDIELNIVEAKDVNMII
jgi:hypothetical protein